MSSKQKNRHFCALSFSQVYVILNIILKATIVSSQDTSASNSSSDLNAIHHTLHAFSDGYLPDYPPFPQNITKEQALEHINIYRKQFMNLAPCTPRNNSVIKIGYLPNNNRLKSPRGVGRDISGALTYAIDLINKEPAKLKGRVLDLLVNDTAGGVLFGTSSILGQWQKGVGVFIGPENSCQIEASLASTLNLPVLSYKCNDARVSDKSFYRTFIRTIPTETHIVNSVISLLNYFEWQKISIVSEQSPIYDNVMRTIVDQAQKYNLSINTQSSFENEKRCCDYKPNSLECRSCRNRIGEIVEETCTKTRIYIFVGSLRELHHFMLAMHKKSLLIEGGYAIIYADIDQDQYDEQHSYYYFRSTGTGANETAGMLAEAARSLLVVVSSPPNSMQLEFNDKVREFNSKEPWNIPQPETGFKHYIPIYAAYLYDAFMLYVDAISGILNEGGDIYDGENVTKRIIKRGHYKSITGSINYIDENGDVSGNYSVLAYVPMSPNVTLNQDSTNTVNYTHTMLPVGFYTMVNDTNLILNMTIDWRNGTMIAEDTPLCGYDGSSCAQDWTITKSDIVVILSVLVAIVVATVLLFHRVWTIERRNANLVWKLNYDEIDFNEDNKKKVDKRKNGHKDNDKSTDGDENSVRKGLARSQSKASLSSQYSAISTSLLYVDRNRYYTSTAKYRNSLVAIKRVRLATKRDNELPLSARLEMKQLKEINNENICLFIGASFEPSTKNSIVLVGEYCARGSLRDLLTNPDVNLDEMFISSLIFDLVSGIDYLHHSEIGYHGNLKSSNCLISSRWVLKLTDFGLLKHRRRLPPPPSSELTSDQTTDSTRSLDNNNHNHESDNLIPKSSRISSTRFASAGKRFINFSFLNPGSSTTEDVNDVSEYCYHKNLLWTPPEILRHPQESPGKPEDIYAFAIIAHEMLANDGPYGLYRTSLTAKEIIDNIMNPSLNACFEEYCYRRRNELEREYKKRALKVYHNTRSDDHDKELKPVLEINDDEVDDDSGTVPPDSQKAKYPKSDSSTNTRYTGRRKSRDFRYFARRLTPEFMDLGYIGRKFGTNQAAKSKEELQSSPDQDKNIELEHINSPQKQQQEHLHTTGQHETQPLLSQESQQELKHKDDELVVISYHSEPVDEQQQLAQMNKLNVSLKTCDQFLVQDISHQQQPIDQPRGSSHVDQQFQEQQQQQNQQQPYQPLNQPCSSWQTDQQFQQQQQQHLEQPRGSSHVDQQFQEPQQQQNQQQPNQPLEQPRGSSDVDQQFQEPQQQQNQQQPNQPLDQPRGSSDVDQQFQEPQQQQNQQQPNQPLDQPCSSWQADQRYRQQQQQHLEQPRGSSHVDQQFQEPQQQQHQQQQHHLQLPDQLELPLSTSQKSEQELTPEDEESVIMAFNSDIEIEHESDLMDTSNVSSQSLNQDIFQCNQPSSQGPTRRQTHAEIKNDLLKEKYKLKLRLLKKELFLIMPEDVVLTDTMREFIHSPRDDEQLLVDTSEAEVDIEKSKQRLIDSLGFNPYTGDKPIFRPLIMADIKSLKGTKSTVKQIMEQCWSEDQSKRPTIGRVRHSLQSLRPNKNRYNLMDNMIRMFEKHTENLEITVKKRTAQLEIEKRKTDMLLYRMLPPPVAHQLINHQFVRPEVFDCVTVFFSDIVGFTIWAAQSTPMQIVEVLNELYTILDDILRYYRVYKVETIGDAYMVVSGVPIHSKTHAADIASMAIDMLQSTSGFKIAHLTGEHSILKLRVGLNSGPVAAGVVGNMMPRYCLFGDTVNLANRMESSGDPLKIHMTIRTKDLLAADGNFVFSERGRIYIKGMGKLKTYWLDGHKDGLLRRSDKPIHSGDLRTWSVAFNGDGEESNSCTNQNDLQGRKTND